MGRFPKIPIFLVILYLTPFRMASEFGGSLGFAVVLVEKLLRNFSTNTTLIPKEPIWTFLKVGGAGGGSSAFEKDAVHTARPLACLKDGSEYEIMRA